MSTLVLRGQWQGEVNSVGRHFCGVVHESGESSVLPGTQVRVTFTGGTQRQEHSAAFHGQYILEGLEPNHFVLTSFVRKDRDAGEQCGPSENEVQVWGGELYSTP